MRLILTIWTMAAAWHGRLVTDRRAGKGDRGAALMEYLAISVAGVVIVVAIIPVFRTLALDVVDWVRGQLGI